jgi:hypothetical protein
MKPPTMMSQRRARPHVDFVSSAAAAAITHRLVVATKSVIMADALRCSPSVDASCRSASLTICFQPPRLSNVLTTTTTMEEARGRPTATRPPVLVAGLETEVSPFVSMAGSRVARSLLGPWQWPSLTMKGHHVGVLTGKVHAVEN